MTEEELFARYPKMRPAKAPTMQLVNGIGTRVYGTRDRDVDTGAYVTTLCFCVLWIPLFCLKSYRVIKARNGWYFLGREPMSVMARAWNFISLIVIATAGMGIRLGVYMGTPEYKARQRMSEARGLVEKGEAGSGAAVYAQLASAGREQSSEATHALRELVGHEATTAPLKEVAVVFKEAERVATRSDALTASELVTAGMGILKARGETDPKGAIALLEVLRPLALDTREIDAMRLPLFQKWAAAEPGNVDAAVGLAEMLMQGNDLAGAKKALEPVQEKLGDGEGARVMGMIYAREGDFEKAGALLGAYVKPRVEALHAAEKAVDGTEERVVNEEVEALRANKGPAELYARLEKATPEEQKRLVREYVQGKLKGNPELIAAQDRLGREVQVVPVTMELGIVLVEGAAGIHDGPRRKAQLEAAKDAFLSIRGFAGESDEYKAFLGQVYYWLGDAAEGRRLFDELLAAKGRSSKALLQVSSTLRQVGVDQEARALAEEAYTKATDADDRYKAAQIRSVMFKDADDQIGWLEKCDTKDPLVRANLSLARADKANEQGKDQEAIGQYRMAAEEYGALARNSRTLNQAALAYADLYTLTGEEKDGARCLECIQQAVDMDPSDPILLYNSSEIVIDATYRSVLGKKVDLRVLKYGGADIVPFLHHDEAGRAALAEEVLSHPGTKRALAYGERCMVITPKAPRSYTTVSLVRSLQRDEAGIQALLEKIRAAGIDDAREMEEWQDALARKDEDKHRESVMASLAKARERSKEARAVGGATAAVALVREANAMQSADLYTNDVDPDAVVTLCEEAHALAPSLGTMGGLQSAYFFKAAKELRKGNPGFEAVYQQHVRVIGCERLIAALATEPGPFQSALRENAAFKKGVESLIAMRQTYNSWAHGREWVLLRDVRPEEAAKLAAIIGKSHWAVLDTEVDAALTPSSPAAAMDVYWDLLALGKEKEAGLALTHVREAGMPLPIRE